MGGRANWNGTNGDEGAASATPTGVNNFQGRYIIRHYWTGPVACKNPRYDTGAAPPRQPGRAADADGREGAGDGAAREGRADGGGRARRCRCSGIPGKPPAPPDDKAK